MNLFCSIRGVLLLIFTAAAASGCSDAVTDPTGPSVVSHAGSGSSVAVHPTVLTPDFVPGDSCASARPFDVRFSLVLTAPRREPLAFRSIQFRFTDRLGTEAVPTAHLLPVPLPGQTTLPPTSPVPIPTSGQSAPILVNAGHVARLPFLLRFGCGLLPSGLIRVSVGTMTGGRPGTNEVAVRVGV